MASIEKKKEDGVITAHHEGVVETVYFNEGVLSCHGKMAKIIDLKDLSVRIYIEEKNLNSIQVGDRVQLGSTTMKTLILKALWSSFHL